MCKKKQLNVNICILQYIKLPSMKSKHSFSQGTQHGSRRYSANLSVTYLKHNMVVGSSHGYQYSASNNHGIVIVSRQYSVEKHRTTMKTHIGFHPLLTPKNEISKKKNVPEKHNSSTIC